MNALIWIIIPLLLNWLIGVLSESGGWNPPFRFSEIPLNGFQGMKVHAWLNISGAYSKYVLTLPYNIIQYLEHGIVDL